MKSQRTKRAAELVAASVVNTRRNSALKDVSVRFPLACPLHCSDRASAAGTKRSGQHFGEFDQIAEWVGEESELATDGGQDERLGHDQDTARAKLGYRLIYAGDVETEMVVAAIFQAIAKVRVGSHFRGQLVA